MVHKIIIKILLAPAFLLFGAFGATLDAQSKVPLIRGIVSDEYGKPLEGAVVKMANGKNRALALTRENGEYAILVNDGSKFFIVSCIGYRDAKIAIGKNVNNTTDVVLHADAGHADEVIQLGYSFQRRGDISGAVSTVSGEELRKTPVANLSTAFAGRLPGLITQESSSELSRASTDFFVRGISANRANGPLVVIDGITYDYKSNQSLEYISPAEIESVTVLKDASTQALYGTQGAEGVIIVTTNRGKLGKLKVNVRMDESMQQMTTRPINISSYEYAKLRNEAAYNDGHGQNYYFSDQQIENFRSGKNRNLYPNNDWYDMFMHKFAQMQRVNVDLQGGNDRLSYFSNVNVMRQGDQFNTDQKNYNAHLIFTWVNFRSNVEMKLNRFLSGVLHLSGNIKREAVPGNGYSTQNLYSSLFYMPPTIYGPLTPSVVDSHTGAITSGNQVVTTQLDATPTYGMINSDGYTRHTVTNINAQYGLNLDMSFLTPGLTASGVVAYQTNTVNSLYTTKNYERWTRTSNFDTLLFVKKGSDNNTTLSYTKNSSYYYHLTYKGLVDYKRDFGLHRVTGVAFVFYKNLSESSTSGNSALAYNRLMSGVEGTYAYNDKYLLKFDLGYSGSDWYARGHRYTATPAISGAWVVSKEPFMQKVKWLSDLKLRASYGETGTDALSSRYSYLDNLTFSTGGTISYLQYLVSEGKSGNASIQAEIVKKQNFGIDFGLFNELFLSIDLFKERRNNMVINNTSEVPLYQGVALANYPTTNSGKYENKGYEITAHYTKSVNKNLSIQVGGFVNYAKNKDIYSGETEKTSDYAYRKQSEGYSYSQDFGYLVDYSNGGNGFFNSTDEIKNSGLSYGIGTPRVGDLKYRDLNKDGIIDERDKAPIGKGGMPRLYYGFSGGVVYKAFDFSFLFQGVGQYSNIYSGTGIYETGYDGIYNSLHQNAWTLERYNNKQKITAPALSLVKSVSHESNDYYNYNLAYLRLKNVEIGYTFPGYLSKKIAASKVRVILSAQNLLTWDKMKSNDFGPEGGGYLSIPVYRVYNVGLSIQFL